MIFRTFWLALVAAGACAAAENPREWSEPHPPHRIAGNLYYVGTKGLAAYLVATPEGHILINNGLVSTVPMIEESVAKMGFRFADIKILVVSHAHWDHIAGSALVTERTGAKYMMMEPDVEVTEDGGKSDFFYGEDPGARYAPVRVDRVLRDGDRVTLGGVELVARLTPGHTKGCTTWTMKVTENGKPYNVVIVGSPNVNNGFQLVNNARYPRIAEDYLRTFEVLKSLECDIFLGAHGDYYGLARKYPRLAAEGPAVFVDPAGYKSYVADRERAFLREWARQKAAPTPAK